MEKISDLVKMMKKKESDEPKNLSKTVRPQSGKEDNLARDPA